MATIQFKSVSKSFSQMDCTQLVEFLQPQSSSSRAIGTECDIAVFPIGAYCMVVTR